MSFSLGLIGLPNVGKSTLFKALTKKQVDISNYPFCTIDPNVGVVSVPDQRLDKLTRVLKPEKIIPTHIEFVDVAGLVKNAHLGEGLGNQFLAHLREVDAMVQIVRCFTDKNVASVRGKINPQEDIELINLELVAADLDTLKKRMSKIKPKAQTGEKEAKERLPILEKINYVLEKGKLAIEVHLMAEEKEKIKDLNLLTEKPMLYLANVDEKDSAYDLGQPSQIALSAKLEADLGELSDQEREELGYKTTGLDKFIQASYQLLDLITFFTSQNKILQAWTIQKNTPLPAAAARVHTDFGEKFIKAEVINWQDLISAGGETQAREKGLIRTEGKNYLVQEGEVLNFKI